MGSIKCELFAKPVAALLSYCVPTTELSSAEIVARECAAIEALAEILVPGQPHMPGEPRTWFIRPILVRFRVT
jgi:hypothetical protein